MEQHLLRKAQDKNQIARYLKQFRRFQHSNIAALEVRFVRLVRYKEKRRALLEYAVFLKNIDGSEKQITLMGKIRFKSLDRKTYSLQKELYRTDFYSKAQDGITVPKPAGIIKDLNMRLYFKERGAPAGELLYGDKDGKLSRRLAQAIFKLHSSSIAPERTHHLQDEIAILDDSLEKACARMPEFIIRIGFLQKQYHQLAQEYSDKILRPIHRDFYADQVICSKKRVCLIDLDLCAMGNPAIDIGNFLAHVREYSLRVLGDALALKTQETAFKDAYLKLNREITSEEIDFFQWLSWIRHIFISVRIPERRSTTASILTLSEEYLQNMKGACNA